MLLQTQAVVYQSCKKTDHCFEEATKEERE